MWTWHWLLLSYYTITRGPSNELLRPLPAGAIYCGGLRENLTYPAQEPLKGNKLQDSQLTSL